MVETGIKDEKFVCSFSGRLDTANCAKWEESLIEKIHEETVPIIFDLKKTDYVSSEFLRVCIRVAKDVGKDKFSIINVNPFVKKVLKIAGLDKILSIK